MYTKDSRYFVDRELVYGMLTMEDEYASRWGDAPGEESVYADFPEHTIAARTGLPFSCIEWINFAQKYLDEAKLADANWLPDQRAIRIRMLKAASLLITALQVHGEHADPQDIAGVSSTKFPLHHRGLLDLTDPGGVE